MPPTFRSVRPLLAAVAAIACAAALPAAAGAQSVPKGPAGDAFYTAPDDKLAGEPGTVIWQRAIKYTPNGRVALKSASKTILVLYRSRDPQGNPIAVSGTVDLPKGKAPKGGWKMVSWAHGTTGVADSCAPSRTAAGSPADGYIQYASASTDAWLKAGYAVLRTDYEGLGTPGPHRYLIGRSEGRSVVDIALAARALVGSRKLSKDYVIGGHSQGGQSALFAASQAASDAPGLRLRGVFAYAPASHIYEQRQFLPTLGEDARGLTGLAVMILDSAAREAGVDPRMLVTDEVAGLMGVLETGCNPQISAAFTDNEVDPKDILRPGIDSTAVDEVLKAMNPALSIPVPVLMLQGKADNTVLPFLSTTLAGELNEKGNKLKFVEYPGLNHMTVVTDKKPSKAVLAFLRSRLGR